MAKEYLLSDTIEDPVLSGTILSYVKSEVPAKRFKALKKGDIAWEEKLDLQSSNSEQARSTLVHFIQMQAQNTERCVLVIHGKDARDNKPPLIKNLINIWLPQLKEVLAFSSAQTVDGGVGAVYVLLKKPHDIPIQLPVGGRKDTFLIAETKAMERSRRLAEQQGERLLAPVQAREHSNEDAVNNAPEGELQNTILQHPELDSQRFDGVDPNLNPEPPLNTDARREYDNEQREQEKEKQLRLGNMPKFNTAPTPQGP